MARFLITAVEKDNGGDITHCIAHTWDGKNVLTGIKRTKDEIIQSLDNNNSYITASWNYTSNQWIIGSEVGTITRNGIRYLRSHRDRTINDNLDNLLPLSNLGL